MFKKLLLPAILFAAIFAAIFAGPAVNSATACPNCKQGLETDNSLPMAYQYSILFMLAVPATVFTGFGYSFYRLSQRNLEKQQALDPEILAQYDARVISALDLDETDPPE